MLRQACGWSVVRSEVHIPFSAQCLSSRLVTFLETPPSSSPISYRQILGKRSSILTFLSLVGLRSTVWLRPGALGALIWLSLVHVLFSFKLPWLLSCALPFLSVEGHNCSILSCRPGPGAWGVQSATFRSTCPALLEIGMCVTCEKVLCIQFFKNAHLYCVLLCVHKLCGTALASAQPRGSA